MSHGGDEIAPALPHPGAPGAPPATKLLAPGLVDRARNPVTGLAAATATAGGRTTRT
ncbi:MULTISPECIES: hypothetical protein [Streptomyces]|uniref:Uncharacterized protein n=1 Tax=Streptomyces ramulosus TaxID=47762 RepID=A0ABW1FCE1_9ACTN